MRARTGSGIQYAPANATTNKISRVTYGSTSGAELCSASNDDTRMPRPSPNALATPFASATLVGSRRGCRSSNAALAVLNAAPVASPCSPRATNSHHTDRARMNNTVEAMSVPSEASNTGRRPT